MADTDKTAPEDKEEFLEWAGEKARMDLPAVYIDKFWMTYWNGHLRLSLGEDSVKTGTHWRFAAVIEAADVRRLIKRLNGILEKIDPSGDSD